jgi:hypothetical protein
MAEDDGPAVRTPATAFLVQLENLEPFSAALASSGRIKVCLGCFDSLFSVAWR